MSSVSNKSIESKVSKSIESKVSKSKVSKSIESKKVEMSKSKKAILRRDAFVVLNQWMSYLKKENEYAVTEIDRLEFISEIDDVVTFEIKYYPPGLPVEPQICFENKQRYLQLQNGIKLCKDVNHFKKLGAFK